MWNASSQLTHSHCRLTLATSYDHYSPLCQKTGPLKLVLSSKDYTVCYRYVAEVLSMGVGGAYTPFLGPWGVPVQK